MKLSTRLVLGTAILVLAATLAVGFFAYRGVETSIYPAQLTRMTSGADLMTERLGATVREVAADVSVNANAPAIEALVEAMAADDAAEVARWKERLGLLFVAGLEAKREYIQLRFVGVADGGREVVRAERTVAGGKVRLVPEDELQSKQHRSYFQATVALTPNTTYLSPIELNQEFGVIQSPHLPVMRVSMPVAGPAGSVLGFIIVNVDLSPAFDRLRAAAGAGTDVYVVNSQGDYLVHPDRTREFGFELGRPARLQDDFPDLWLALKPGSVESRSSLTVTDASGTRYAAAASGRYLGGDTWVAVLLLAPRAVVLAPADAILYSVSGAGAAAIAVAVILSLMLARTVARPLGRLADSMKRFDRGEAVSLPTRGPAEVMSLVGAFHRHIENERLFTAAVQSTSDAVLTERLDGTITAWNSAAEKLFGYTAEEAIGRRVDMLVPKGFEGEFKELFERLQAGLPTQALETVRVTKDGDHRQVSLSISPVHSLNGELVGATAIYRDVAEARRADAMFRIAAEASPAAMLMVDTTGLISLVNAEALGMFGYRRDELTGKPVESLIPERFRGRHPDLRHGYNRDSQRRPMGVGRDLYGLRKDGSEFPVEVGLSPIETPDGPMVLGVVVDITERRLAAMQLEQRTDELQRSNAELQQFAYVASHDLQEPLRMVSSFCELLRERYRDRLDGEALEFIDFAVDGAQRMRQLINDLLDYSRLQTRDVALTAVSAQACIDTALLNLSESIREHDAEIVVHPLPQVLANEGQVTRLFQNLISNSLKFSKVDRRPKVEISAKEDGPMWQFSVTDNGIGIDPRQADAVFGVFQRLHTRDEYPGTGIGLAVCKRIVERHGGSIWLESGRGEGAIFHFTLRSAAAAAGEPAARDAHQRSPVAREEGSDDVRRAG